ncbi:MAG TPA: heme ABC transporter ATP-binding protein [Anaerolineae bacterium]|nr:heme ABC transporter ATP-binding protein [Anaerolineae bacterium]
MRNLLVTHHSSLMLSIQSITIRYNSRTILHDLTLGVQAGEVVALIGPNGVGKSTLIKAISGSVPIASGRALIDDRDLSQLPIEQRARLIAVVPQAVRLPESFTVLDTVLMGRTPYIGWLGRESDADRTVAADVMERTCITELAARRIGELSGGEQQRVLIARALAQAAKTLLLDEPTAHLDLKHQAGILSLVRDLARNEGFAILIALHDLNLASQYADRVALLSNGSLAALGTPEEVLTTELLSPVYGLRISVYEHPEHGTPWIMADSKG